MFCPNCGTQQPDGAKFCANCGAPLSGPVPDQPQAPTPSPSQPQASYQSAARSTKKFDPLRIGSIAACLAILASWFLTSFYVDGDSISMFIGFSQAYEVASSHDLRNGILIFVVAVVGVELIGLIINLLCERKAATVVATVLVLLGVAAYVLFSIYLIKENEYVPGPGFFVPIVGAAALLVLCIVRLFKKKSVA